MCFSAQASFGVGAALAVAGIISIKKSRRPSQLPFASIPLLFATQQIAEGILWLTLTGEANEEWRKGSMSVFLFFAQVLWPLWVPFSIWLLEKETARKKILFALVCIGVFTSCCLAYFLLAYPANAQLRNNHIFYALGFPALSMRLGMLYFIPTVVTSFLSSHPGVRWMGLAILTSFSVSKIFFKEELISVWCFFAAVISAVVVLIVHFLKKRPTNAAGDLSDSEADKT